LIGPSKQLLVVPTNSYVRLGNPRNLASALFQTNYALALLALKQYREAELAARRALALDHGAEEANYALGMTLYAQNNCAAEAVENLKTGAASSRTRGWRPLAY